MRHLKNQAGSVIVFATVTIVFLLIMVGIGLDTGWVTFSRSMGQRAVDMAALAGAAGLAKGDAAAVKANVEALNINNDYVKASGNTIDGTIGGNNVMLVKYDAATGTITPETDINQANGVRVALEQTNPYTATTSASAINTPSFMMPLLNLFGSGVPTATDVNVSAVAVYSTIPGIPLALGRCTPGEQNVFFQTPSGGSNPNNSAWTTYTVNETSTPGIIKRVRSIINCQGGGEATVGTPICLANGQNTPVVREFETLADPNGERCYFTPVVADQQNFNGCTGENNKIQSWAEVCILHVCAPPDSNKNPKCADSNKTYIIANVKRCDLQDNERVGQCFRQTLVREPEVAM